MKLRTRHYVWIGILAVLVVAAITNPPVEAHRAAMNRALHQYMDEKGVEPGNLTSALLTGTLLSAGTDQLVRADNYFFFSLTRLDLVVTTRTIGIGIFGHVLLYGSVQDMIAHEKNKWMDKLK